MCPECGFTGFWLQPPDPDVTFFFFVGHGEGGRAGGLPGAVGRPAGVLAGVLGEGVDDDEHGAARLLVEVEHHVLGGTDRPPVVEPADLGLRRAGDAGVKARHLPGRHREARERLREKRLLADGRFLDGGGGDETLGRGGSLVP